MLSISDKYKIDTEIKFKENDNIRELLIIPKKNLKSNNNKNDIIYIIINYNDIVEKGCIEALDYNENLVFDNIELKNKYDKIIKFGIAFNEKICDVIYEINYGNLFKKKEMQKEMQKNLYKGEKYRDAINDNRYLIDKTKMISELIQQKYDVFLITRPRRFGKSLNLSMIKEFFEKPINEIENEDKKFVFDGLEVSKDRKNMRHFHKYPVIYLNFKGIQGNNFEEIKNFLIDIISTLFKNMRNKIEFEKLDDLDKRDWNEIENKNKNNIKLLINSLSFMCSCLRKFYKRRCIILIDEYDQVLINSIKKKVFDIVQPIIERIFSCAFKGNDNLYFGVITGCYHFGLNSSNSGANNFTKCSLLKDNYFSDCYGFTEDELKNILSNFNITDSKEKSDDIEDGIKERLKKKYGGYSCVSNIGIIKNIYNPYSVMKFVQKNKNKRDNFELSNYWNYPEKNEKLKNFLKNSNFNFNAKFLNLLCGKIVDLSFDYYSPIEYDYLKKDNSYNDIWKVLFFSGYLTVADEEEYKENIKNMNNKMIKIKSNKSKLMEIDSNEIQSYKNNLLEKKEWNDIIYFKIPNQKVLEYLHHLIDELNNKKK